MTEQFSTRPEDLLRDQVRGLCDNIFIAERAYKLAFVIGGHAKQLNRASYGIAFGVVQTALEQTVVLSVTKLFEQPHRKYATRTIPATLNILKRYADCLPISSKIGMLSRLSRGGVEISSDCSDEELTRMLVSKFGALLPGVDTLDGIHHLRRIDALRFRRDKVIAHSESLNDAEVPHATWGDIRQLLNLAEVFTDVVSTGYLGLYQTGDDGTFFLTQDAAGAARTMERALKTLLDQ